MQQIHPTEGRVASALQSVASATARAHSGAQAIKDGAQARLEAVLKRMEALRPQVLLSSDAATEYQSLVIERHRLNMVVMAP